MNSDEERILKEICKKYDLEFDCINELINIEKKFARRNKARRSGVFNELREVIEDWSKGGKDH